MSYVSEIKNLKYVLDYTIINDVKHTGKPSIIYNYSHKMNKFNIINTLEEWQKEQDELISQGLVKTQMEITYSRWKCILWVFQPLNKYNRAFNEKRYFELTNYKLDPLAEAVGVKISGFCYLELLNRNV